MVTVSISDGSVEVRAYMKPTEPWSVKPTRCELRGLVRDDIDRVDDVHAVDVELLQRASQSSWTPASQGVGGWLSVTPFGVPRLDGVTAYRTRTPGDESSG